MTICDTEKHDTIIQTIHASYHDKAADFYKVTEVDQVLGKIK